eukprot:259933-Chlamydomonas_euryale.AAC.1
MRSRARVCGHVRVRVVTCACVCGHICVRVWSRARACVVTCACVWSRACACAGWFTQPTPFFSGGLTAEEAQPVLDAAMQEVMDVLAELPVATGGPGRTQPPSHLSHPLQQVVDVLAELPVATGGPGRRPLAERSTFAQATGSRPPHGGQASL